MNTPAGQKSPDDPLHFIKQCVRHRRILWTYHVNMRLKRRHIPRGAILEAIESYEMVEAYPEDKYLPSYLVLAKSAAYAFTSCSLQTWREAMCGLSPPIGQARKSGKTI